MIALVPLFVDIIDLHRKWVIFDNHFNKNSGSVPEIISNSFEY